MPWVVPDFETVSGVDLKKAGAWRYAEDPTTEIICLSWCVGDGPVLRWYPGDPLPAVLRERIEDPDTVFVAHSAQFEKAHWRRHLVELYGWPDIPNSRWHDTAARCANLTLPPGLEKALAVLGLPVQKDMEGSRLTIGLSRINKRTGMWPEITPEIKERVGQYCDVDVDSQRGLHKRIGWLPDDERIVYLMDQEINERGVRLDVPLIRAMKQVVDKASGPLAREFENITGGLKFTQRDKVMSWVLDRGVMLPDLRKETLDALFGETDEGEAVDDKLDLDLPHDVERALHIRRLIGSASVKKLTAMQACVCADGRARGLLAYHGAGTGRWAGRLLQPQNFPRGSLTEDGDNKPAIGPLVDALMTGDPDYVECLYGPAVEAVVSSLRHTIIASPDNLLLAGDYSTIEARLVLAIAGQDDKVELLRNGGDPYNDMASDIYGRPINRKKAEDQEEGQVGKNSVLGLGFAMGKDKFHDRYCPDQPLDFAAHVVKTYREEWAPRVPELWRGLEDAALHTVQYRRPHEAYGVLYQLEDDWLTARLPSGRKLWYYQPRLVRRAMPWDPDDIRLAWTYREWKMGRMVTSDAYGGLLTNNVVQGAARDLLVVAMRKARNEGLNAVLTVHDELVLDVPEARADPKMLKQIMEDTPPWAAAIKVPVKSECWAGDRYHK